MRDLAYRLISVTKYIERSSLTVILVNNDYLIVDQRVNWCYLLFNFFIVLFVNISGLFKHVYMHDYIILPLVVTYDADTYFQTLVRGFLNS